MAGIGRLIHTNELKMTRLAQSTPSERRPLVLHYDSDFDALIMLAAPADTETVVHYIDDHVALHYEPETLEIVGLQIEDFKSSFLPRHDTVRRVWRLSEANKKLEDFGDMIVTFERLKPQVAREVALVTKDLLPQGAELAAVFA